MQLLDAIKGQASTDTMSIKQMGPIATDKKLLL